MAALLAVVCAAVWVPCEAGANPISDLFGKLFGSEKSAEAAKKKPSKAPQRRGRSQSGHGRSRQNLMEKLDRKGVLALHKRKAEYPEAGDFADIALSFTRIDPSVLSQLFPLTAPAKMDTLARQSARQYNVDPLLVLAVIKVESDFNPNAVSSAGARGLMQLMPETAIDMGVRNVFDPAQNIAAGTQYLARLLELFENDRRLCLAAYHAGPAAVKKYGGVPPFKGVDTYIERVERYIVEFGEEEPKEIQVAAVIVEPAKDSLPNTEGRHYVIRFQDGLTQPAEVIVVSEEYYLVTYQGRTERVQKEHVAEIVEST